MINNVDPQLNQWDVGRSVRVSDSNATHIHFANQGDSKAVIIEIKDGSAKIPDYLLQTGKTVIAYAVLDGVTLESKSFSVSKRERPENYVYEDDQRNYIYELITNAESAVENANLAIENANTASNSASIAATNANVAAGNANDASDKANIATENANKATEMANEAVAMATNAVKRMMVVGGAKGESISLSDAIDQPLVGLRVFGKTTQDGTPTPDAPVDLVSVGDSGGITVNVAGANDAQSMTIATPNGLPGIPAKSGGNYTDANGQQWVCDEIDFARGVYVQRVDTREIAESSRIAIASYGTAGYYRIVISDVDTATGSTVPSVCSHFIRKVQWEKNEDYHYVAGDVTSKAYLFTNKWSSVSAFSAWLKEQADKGTPLTIIYKRGTPIETPLSEEELAAYAALHTYRNNTTVSNDAGAYMDLEYVMDAKKYIDSLVTGGIAPARVE